MSRARVLVVDDEPAMLHAVQRTLGGEYEVRGETRSTAALAVAREFAPQLAIIDIRMPDLDGFRLMNELKRLNPELQVILMTGSVYDIDDQLVRAIREKAFYYIQKPFDRGVLLALAQRALELDALASANRQHLAHLQSQLDEARAFQQTMLPPAQGAVGPFQIFASHQPCAEVAGDFYDYAPVGPHAVTVIVADVVGHGASAAMMTALVKSAFHASQADGCEPAAIVRRVARAIAGFAHDRFVTLLCARISASLQTLEYVNAGHLGGTIYARGDRGCQLGPTGPIVSPALPMATWEQVSVPWKAGSVALLFTDGIPETLRAGEVFGTERVDQVVARCAVQYAAVVPSLVAAVEAFAERKPAADDRTVLAVWQQ